MVFTWILSMQKATAALMIALISLLFLKDCPIMAKPEEVSIPSSSLSLIKLKKFLALALLLSETNHPKKRGMHYFSHPSHKINKKITPP